MNGSDGSKLLSEQHIAVEVARLRAENNRLRQALRPVTTRTGLPVHLEDVRAGDRLRIADGPMAGTIFMVDSTQYQAGVLSITPENRPDVPLLLARRR